MSPSPTTPVAAPSRHRLAGLALAGAVCGAALLAMPLARPPGAIGELAPWWTSVGTATATVSILRVLALLSAGWTVLVAGVGLLASTTRRIALARLWSAIAPHSVRRAVAISVVVAGVSAPASANGAEAVPTLRDLGPTEEPARPEQPVLTDLGPAEVAAFPDAATPPPRSPAPTPELWVVERGDHLWHIAAETLTERGAAASESDTLEYWRRLIDANRDAIGPNPDLIHPGAVLTLP